MAFIATHTKKRHTSKNNIMAKGPTFSVLVLFLFILLAV